MSRNIVTKFSVFFLINLLFSINGFRLSARSSCEFHLDRLSIQTLERALPFSVGIAHLFENTYMIATSRGMVIASQGRLDRTGPVSYTFNDFSKLRSGFSPLIAIRDMWGIESRHQEIIQAIESRDPKVLEEIFPEGLGVAYQYATENNGQTTQYFLGRARTLKFLSIFAPIIAGASLLFIPTSMMRDYLGNPTSPMLRLGDQSREAFWKKTVLPYSGFIYYLERAEFSELRPTEPVQSYKSWYGDVLDHRNVRDHVIERATILSNYFSQPESLRNVFQFVQNTSIAIEGDIAGFDRSGNLVLPVYISSEILGDAKVDLGFRSEKLHARSIRALLKSQNLNDPGIQAILLYLYVQPSFGEVKNPKSGAAIDLTWREILGIEKVGETFRFSDQ